MDKSWMTPAIRDAIEKIGRRRKKNRVKAGKDISWKTFKRLQQYRLVMLYGDDCVMFTYNGERIWSELHPNSKYRISR